MVKFKYLFLFLVVIFISFAKNIEEIEDMTINIEERLSLNGDIKKSEYILQYIKPDFIRKVILSPELNKGEIYIYDSKKKVMYLPLFDQVSEEILNEEEDSTLEAINYILKEKKELIASKVLSSSSSKRWINNRVKKVKEIFRIYFTRDHYNL